MVHLSVGKQIGGRTLRVIYFIEWFFEDVGHLCLRFVPKELQLEVFFLTTKLLYMLDL